MCIGPTVAFWISNVCPVLDASVSQNWNGTGPVITCYLGSGQLPELEASVGVDFCHAATSLVPPPGGSSLQGFIRSGYYPMLTDGKTTWVIRLLDMYSTRIGTAWSEKCSKMAPKVGRQLSSSTLALVCCATLLGTIMSHYDVLMMHHF